jgi:N,N'-diacetylbacillosaminyl-diphospho-undecaprenol alpha-1,3-N-acetylgalactosaminyltransferase
MPTIKKICISSNTDWSIITYRAGLIKQLQELCDSLITICSDIGFSKELKKRNLGFLILLRSYVKPISIIKDVLLIFEYYKIFKTEKPDILHNFTIKPVIYGSIAAKLAGVPCIVNTITGLGFVYTGNSIKHKIIRFVTNRLYTIAFKMSHFTWFQNKDDYDYFVNQKKLIKAEHAGIINGSGVNIDEFSPEAIPKESKNKIQEELHIDKSDIVVTFISRMLYDKGVSELIEAIRKLKYKNISARFLFVGPLAPGNPAMVPEKELLQWESEGLIAYLGRRRDIKELLSISSILVFPSFYREGTPKVLLEAGAMGIPLITTNSIGCKDVVEDGINGILVPVKDVESLVAAMEKLILDPDLREKYGKASREKIVKEYDEKQIVRQTIQKYEELYL